MHLFNNIKYLLKTIFGYNRLKMELDFISLKRLLLNDKTLNEEQYEELYNIIVRGGLSDLHNIDYINTFNYGVKYDHVFWKYGLVLGFDNPIKIYNAFKKEYV